MLQQGLKFLAVAAAVGLVSTLGVAAYAAADLNRTFSHNAVDIRPDGAPPPNIAELDNRGVNILLTGIDTCEEEHKDAFGERCEEDGLVEHGNGVGLNDVTLLVHISPEPRTVTVITFPRDLLAPAPDCTADDGTEYYASERVQLNEAYSRGNLGCIASTVSGISGQDIDYAALVTWGGVIEITNAIGGVDVCVGGDGIYDPLTGLNLDPGEHTLAGFDALQFLRTRNGVGDGSDLARIGNQQVYMTSLVRKLTSEEVLTNPGRLLTLSRTALENVTPSSSLDAGTLVKLAMATRDVPLSEWVFVQYPVLDDVYDPNRVVPLQEAADELFAALGANRSITLAGETGQGVVVDGEDDDTSDDGTSDDGAAGADDGTTLPTPSPSESAQLGSAIHGTNAEQVTCSAGRG